MNNISIENNNQIPLQLVINYNSQENMNISEDQAKEKALIFLEKLVEINSHFKDSEILNIPPIQQVAQHINVLNGTPIISTELVQLLDKTFNINIDEIHKYKILNNATEALETSNLNSLSWQQSIEKLNEIMMNHYLTCHEFKGLEIMSQLLYNGERSNTLGALEAANTIVSNKCFILLAVYGLYFVQDQKFFESNLNQLIRILKHNVKVKMSAIKSTVAASLNVAENLKELDKSEFLTQNLNKVSHEKPFFKRKPVLMMLGMGIFGIITVGTSILFGENTFSNITAENIKDINTIV